jgi:aryl-alcohol dehydrogenase-like predicted oxidoreductase
MYNLVKRQAEVEILPMAASEKLGVIPYNPLAGGLLTGKYLQEVPVGRFKVDEGYQKRYSSPKVAEGVEKLVRFAREIGQSPTALAVAWVMHHPAVTAPIIGARSVEQLEGSLAALKIDMTGELYGRLGELTDAPPQATDR